MTTFEELSDVFVVQGEVHPVEAAAMSGFARQLQVVFPLDYVFVLEEWGPGVFGRDFRVLTPDVSDPTIGLGNYYDLDLPDARLQREILDDSPISLYPEAGGVLPWGELEMFTCGWRIGIDRMPKSVVVFPTASPSTSREYSLSMSSFVLAIFTQPDFDSDWFGSYSSQPHTFTPFLN